LTKAQNIPVLVPGKIAQLQQFTFTTAYLLFVARIISQIQQDFNKVLQQCSHGGDYISRVVLLHTQQDDDRQTLQPFSARLIKGLDATP